MPSVTSPAEVHQAGQEAIASLAAQQAKNAWPLLDVHNLTTSSAQLIDALNALVTKYGQAASAGALNYYRSLRVADVPGRVSLTVAPPVPKTEVIGVVRSSLSPMYGPVTEKTTLEAQTNVQTGVEQLVLGQSRNTLLANIDRDPAAKGWVRTVEPGACAFCVMLALRAGTGLLYKTAKSGGFQAHPNCRCNVEPVFTAFEPSHDMRNMQSLWRQSTRGEKTDKLAAFRQALDDQRNAV